MHRGVVGRGSMHAERLRGRGRRRRRGLRARSRRRRNVRQLGVGRRRVRTEDDGLTGSIALDPNRGLLPATVTRAGGDLHLRLVDRGVVSLHRLRDRVLLPLGRG